MRDVTESSQAEPNQHMELVPWFKKTHSHLDEYEFGYGIFYLATFACFVAPLVAYAVLGDAIRMYRSQPTLYLSSIVISAAWMGVGIAVVRSSETLVVRRIAAMVAGGPIHSMILVMQGVVGLFFACLVSVIFRGDMSATSFTVAVLVMPVIISTIWLFLSPQSLIGTLTSALAYLSLCVLTVLIVLWLDDSAVSKALNAIRLKKPPESIAGLDRDKPHASAIVR